MELRFYRQRGKLIKRVEENLAMGREGSACKHEEGLLWIHPATGFCSIGYRMTGCFVTRVKEVGRSWENFGGWMLGHCKWRGNLAVEEFSTSHGGWRWLRKNRRFNFRFRHQIYVSPVLDERIRTRTYVEILFISFDCFQLIIVSIIQFNFTNFFHNNYLAPGIILYNIVSSSC